MLSSYLLCTLPSAHGFGRSKNEEIRPREENDGRREREKKKCRNGEEGGGGRKREKEQIRENLLGKQKTRAEFQGKQNQSLCGSRNASTLCSALAGGFS